MVMSHDELDFQSLVMRVFLLFFFKIQAVVPPMHEIKNHQESTRGTQCAQHAFLSV